VKRILIVAPYFLIGGVETSILRLVELLKDKANFTLLITKKIDTNINLKIPGLKIINLTVLQRMQYIQLLMLKIIANRYDVLINSFDDLTQQNLNLIKTERKYCFVRNNHLTMDKLYDINKSHVTGYICNSKSAFTRYKERGMPAHYIQNSIKVPENLKLNPLIKKINNNKYLNILYVGRLVDESKGIFDLPKIITDINKKLSNKLELKLNIIGDGPDKLELERLLNLSNVQYSLLGFKTKDEVYFAMHETEFILIPSWYEGMPNVLLESLASGCIPITRRLKGVTDDILEFSGEYLLFDDYDDASKKLLNLIENRKLVKQLRRKCIEQSKYYSPNAEAIEYERILF
jgi:glycosyltransferase involved in cell wall biosynthesis